MKIILPLLFIAFGVEALCQCQLNNAEFLTQEQVDSFSIKYPNCETIDGDIILRGSSISSLSGLNQLISINGSLQIINTSIQTLEGLDNLKSSAGLLIENNNSLEDLNHLKLLEFIYGTVEIKDNSLLRDATGLRNLSEVNGSLIFHTNPSLSDLPRFDLLVRLESLDIFRSESLKLLEGFDNLIHIEKDLRISTNLHLETFNALHNLRYVGRSFNLFSLAIEQLDGFENLEFVDSNFIVQYLTSLKNLNGFNKLTRIGGQFRFENGRSLKVLNAFNRIDTVFESVSFFDHHFLEQFHVFDSLKHIGGSLTIRRMTLDSLFFGFQNLEFIGSDFEFLENDCRGATLEFASLEKIQETLNFNENTLSGSSLSFNNLLFLSNSLIIGRNTGDFKIEFPRLRLIGGRFLSIHDNLGLKTVDGLNALISNTTLIRIAKNEELVSIKGFNLIRKQINDILIEENPQLENVPGFTRLDETESLTFLSNSSLYDLSGFKNLEVVNQDLVFDDLPVFENLMHFDNIKAIKGKLKIVSNDILKSLHGLNAFDPNQLQSLSIEDNPLLSICNVQSICDYLNLQFSDSIINDNANDCNDDDDILKLCSISSVDDLDLYDFTISPNPVLSSLIIKTEFKSSNYVIYNLFGEQILKGTYRNHEINVSNLESGVYVLMLKGNGTTMMKKFIKTN